VTYRHLTDTDTTKELTVARIAEHQDEPRIDKVVTRERLYGSESRWRRFGEPTPAGATLHDDGSPDHGVFGPGTIAWQILLHPATIVFQFAFQQKLQLAYKPIAAGIRDKDPIYRNARRGTLTVFDVFERGQRNSGIHAPMWLGDTPTAQRVAKHLRNIHVKVAGDVIDAGEPALGGYAANSPRDAMWAALTEMHSMLWLYESFAFRDGGEPHPLTAAERDRFVAEVAQYCRLFGSPEDEIPTTMAELEALYDRYDRYFRPSPTIWDDPESGENMLALFHENLARNHHYSQAWATRPLVSLNVRSDDAINGAFPPRYRAYLGLDAEAEERAVRALRDDLGRIRRMQGPKTEQHYMRLMWGPDATTLIESARRLQQESGLARAS
jgi:uncharacterized protein (DUF2236 family)